ncbi:hypothetical protein ACHAQJ_001292 [Trichoderma viride]
MPRQPKKAKPAKTTGKGTGATAINFQPVLRQDVPEWRLADDATDYSVGDTSITTPDESAAIARNAAKWRSLGHVTGVQVLHKWETTPKNISELAGYNGFNTATLANFTDTIVCDIIPSGLRFGYHKFDIEQAKSLLPQSNAGAFDVMSRLPEQMIPWYNELRSCVQALSKKTTNKMINPADLVNSFCTDNQLKSLIEKIATLLPEPMFLPITRNMVTQRMDEEDSIDVTATVLAHAIQILLFAPTKWNKDIVYKRDSNEYTRRYPTPPGHGGDCRTVAGIFSLEDLHRSVLLLYLAIYRRTSGGNINSSRAPQARGIFLGYFDVLTQKPTPGETDLTAMQLATTRLLDNPLSITYTIKEPVHTEDLETAEEAADALRTHSPRENSGKSGGTVAFDNRVMNLQSLYIECASIRQNLRRHDRDAADLAGNQPLHETLEDMTKKERYGWKDPERGLERVLQQTTSFITYAEERKLLEFSEQGASSPAVQEFIAAHPDQEKGLVDTMRRSYALEMTFNGNPPPEDTDLLEVCKRFDISWPEMQLYKDPNSQPLKPHQIADLGVIFEKLDSIGHVFLCNEVGLGKTKVFAAMVECRARDIEAKAAANPDGNQEVFFPTLVVNPVPTIHQTHAEFKRNFPGLNVVLYYSSKSQARKFDGATVLEKGEFISFLRGLPPTNPVSGRTVILTTYSTIHRREILRLEQRFVFVDEEKRGPAYKRQRTDKFPDSAAARDASSDDEASTDEAFRQRLAQKETERIRTYYKGDPQLKGRRFEILAGPDKRTPDGYLVEYRLYNETLANVRWGLLIVDEAHTAWKVGGVYNHTFRLLNWRHLV